MVTLRELFPSIVCERLTIYHLLIDNYHIECDKLLVFRIRRDDDILTEMMKNIHFRNNKTKSIFIVLIEDIQAKNNFACKAEIHVVPCLRHVEKWVPPLIKMLCRSGNRYFGKSNNSFFIDTEKSSTDSICCVELQSMIAEVLVACAAERKQSKQSATCHLAFLSMTIDDIDFSCIKSHHIFITLIPTLGQNRQGERANVYGGHEVILGIFHILQKMNLITSTRMPKIRGARFDPMKEEFEQKV
ncbi:hypothetical protein ACF0H5_014292 [Mactra antiquata]